MYLEEYLGEFVSTYCYNNFAPEPRPFMEEIGELWDPLDPAQSHQEAVALLTDAHHRRQSAPTTPRRWGEPWHTHEHAVPELEALVARALAAQGDFDGAQAALMRGLGAHQDWPGWVLQLKALTIGRIFKSAGSSEAAFDSLWLAVRIWTEGPRDVDVDLLLETLCELATLGHVSPLHPEPAEWARVVAAMTSAESDDEWHPGSWFEREFRVPISQVAATTPPATGAPIDHAPSPATAGTHTHLNNLPEHRAAAEYNAVTLTAASVGAPGRVEKLTPEDLGRYQQQETAKDEPQEAEPQRRLQAEEQRRQFQKRSTDSKDLERQAAEHRAARLKRTGRLENLYVEAVALADSPLSSWPPPDGVPGLLPGARDALRDLHFRDYNVVLVATGLSLTGENPTFWNWYVRHFGSKEGLWPDQLMVNWSRSRLQGWDLLVTEQGRAEYYSPDERGTHTIIELGTPEFPDWSAVMTYLQNRD